MQLPGNENNQFPLLLGGLVDQLEDVTAPLMELKRLSDLLS